MKKEPKKCKCGCGQEVKSWGREYTHKCAMKKFRGDSNPSRRPEVKAKISAKLKGRVFTDEWKENLSKNHHLKDKTLEEVYGSIKGNKLREGRGDFARDRTYEEIFGDEAIQKREVRKGENNGSWKGGITPLSQSIRQLPESINWRDGIFERDDFTCQECGKRGVHLEAHHLKRFSEILEVFLKKYNQFSPIEDKETLTRLALSYKPFWDLMNGQTLCEDCHNLTKGRIKK